MSIYFLFGKTGTGKTYVGDLLSEKTGLLHIDGDKVITDRMRDALKDEVPITRDMIDEFVVELKSHIKKQLAKTPNRSFIISQAMYMNEHRHYLLKAFPKQLKMIWVDSNDVIRLQRIVKRYQQGKSMVTMACAREMDTHFETPDHPMFHLMNNGDDDGLVETFHKTFGETKRAIEQVQHA